MKLIRFVSVLLLLATTYSAQTGKTAARKIDRTGPYTIEQYLTIKSAASPSFSPDGRQIVYLSNTTGTTQVYAIAIAGGPAKQLTNFNDNVSFARWLGDGSGIVFGKAKGGDENTQFYWMKSDGTSVKPLTNDATVRHNFAASGSTGKWIAYASNKRNRQYFDLYTLELASGKETLISQFDGNQSIAAVSDDGMRFVVSRDGTELSLDNSLFLLGGDGKEQLLTPHTGASQYGNVSFLPDGKSLVLGMNNGREFISLTNLRLKNAANSTDWSDANREIKVLDETPWDVTDIEAPQSASTVAYAINENGFSRLYLRPIETGGKPLVTLFNSKPKEIDLPDKGIVSGLTFSRDQTKLAFSFNSATRNSDIWICDVKTGALSQLTQSDLSGVYAGTFAAPRLVSYSTFDGKSIPAWFYEPRIKLDPPPTTNAQTVDINTPATEEIAMSRKSQLGQPPLARISNDANAPVVKGPPRRIIISVHGGPEGQERPGFNPIYQYFISRGYSILATNVRGSTGYGKTFTHLDDVEKREDSVKDLAASVPWLSIQGASDNNRIAVMGGSYGGYMTLAAITLYPDLFSAAVSTVGIANWESFLKNTSSYRRRQREVEYGRLDRDIDFLRSISPINKVDSIRSPLFVIQGKNDPRVPYTEAEQIVTAIRKNGGVVDYKLFDDEGHGISKLKNRLELFPLVADFLDKNMK